MALVPPVRVSKCLECLREGCRMAARGLCGACYADVDVRGRHPRVGGRHRHEAEDRRSREDATELELEELIAERMSDLPAWWGEEVGDDGE